MAAPVPEALVTASHSLLAAAAENNVKRVHAVP